MEKHLAPKNVLVVQHQFLSKYQTDSQSIADYIAELRSELADCEFVSPCDCKVSIADIFLRAQFIRGIKDNTVREQLLQSEKSSFNDIVTKAIALESSKIDSRVLAQKLSTLTSTNTSDSYINKVSSNSKKSHQQSRGNINYKELGIDGLCLRCGQNNHQVKNCQIDKCELKCFECDIVGHVSRVCIRTLLQRKSEPIESTNYVQEDEVACYHSYGIN